MAYQQLENFLRGNPPNIYYTYNYDMYRNGANVIIRFRTDVSAVQSPGYEDYAFDQAIYIDGNLVDSRRIIQANTHTWSAFSVETGWITISNKTSGNLAITIRSTTNDGDFVSPFDKGYSIAVPVAVATITSTQDFNISDIGGSFSVGVSNPSGLDVEMIITAQGEQGDTVLYDERMSGVNGYVGFGYTAAQLCPLIPNSNTLTISIQLKTWSGSTQIGDTQNAIIYGHIINSNPIFVDFTFADIDVAIRGPTPLTDSAQKLVSGYSDVRATITTANKAVAQNYATMDKYRLTIGTQTVEMDYSASATVNLDLLNVLSGTIIVTAIDSRGNQTSVTKTATILSLIPISISRLIAARSNMIDAQTKLSITAKIHLLNFGAVINSVQSFIYQYKLTSSSTWITGSTELVAEPDSSENIVIDDLIIAGDLSGLNGFTTGKNYNIRLIINDYLTSYTSNVLLIGDPLLDLGVDYSGDVPSTYMALGMMSSTGKGIQSAGGFFDKTGAKLCPTGMSFEWNSGTIPTGYLEEDGSAKSRTTYADLFAVIGTTYGAGDGSTTFNLPNSKGKVAASKSSSGTFNTLGAGSITVLGEETHTLTVDEMPSHRHNYYFDYNDGVNWLIGLYGGSANPSISTITNGIQGRSYTFNIRENGGGQPHNNIQPSIVKRKIIKY